MEGPVALKLHQHCPHGQGLGQLGGLHDLGLQCGKLAVELLLQAIPAGGQGLALGGAESHIRQLAGEGGDLLRQLAGGARGAAEQGLALLDLQQQAIAVEAGEERQLGGALGAIRSGEGTLPGSIKSLNLSQPC
jgi:hypothetical protein